MTEDDLPYHGTFVLTEPMVRAYRFSNRYYETLPRWIDELRDQGRLVFMRSNPPVLEVRDEHGNPVHGYASLGDWITLDAHGVVSHMRDEQFRLQYQLLSSGA